MTDEEYAMTQSLLLSIGTQVLLLDLASFLSRIDRCHALGPFADPTLYHQGMRGLNRIERVARAALAFQRECKAANEQE